MARTALMIQNKHIISNRYVYIHSHYKHDSYILERIVTHVSTFCCIVSEIQPRLLTRCNRCKSGKNRSFLRLFPPNTLLSNSLIFQAFSSEWPSYGLFMTHCTDFMDSTTHVRRSLIRCCWNLASGTVCQPSCENQTLHSDNFNTHSKRIYLLTDSCSAE